MTKPQYAGLAVLTLLGGIIGGGAVGFLLGATALSAERQDVEFRDVTARAIKVVDEKNRVRVVLETSEEGDASVLLLDSSGIKRAGLRLDASRNSDTASIGLTDAAGRPLLVLEVSSDGPLIGLADASGKPRVTLGALSSTGGVGVTLNGADGHSRAVWAVTSDDNTTALELNDADGNTKASLHVRADGEPNLVFLNEKGDVVENAR